MIPRFRRARIGVAALVVTLLMAPAAPAFAQGDGTDPATEQGRELVHLFYTGELQTLWDRMSEQMHQGLGSMETFEGFHSQVQGQLGGESEVVSEEVSSQQGMTVYTRRARFENTADTMIDVVFATDAEGTITGFYIRPAQQAPAPAAGGGGDVADNDYAAVARHEGIATAIPSAPWPVRAEGQQHAVYELLVHNEREAEITVSRLAVTDGDSELFVLEGAELAAAASGGLDIAPDGQTRLFVWLSRAEADDWPESLHHTLLMESGGESRAVAGPVVAVVADSPVAVGPPLRGDRWLTANGPANDSGHRRAAANAYAGWPIAQRFAIDFVQVDASGSTFDGDAEDNTAYHAWGAEALAVADATVAAVKDGIPENVPGITSRAVEITLETIAGNYVMLDLGQGRYALYAHFVPGSITVAEGDTVTRGTVLGRVGNSGNSTEPHLHFHVSDDPVPLAGEGLPWVLEEFRLQGSVADLESIADVADAPVHRAEVPLGNRLIAFPEQ